MWNFFAVKSCPTLRQTSDIVVFPQYELEFTVSCESCTLFLQVTRVRGKLWHSCVVMSTYTTANHASLINVSVLMTLLLNKPQKVLVFYFSASWGWLYLTYLRHRGFVCLSTLECSWLLYIKLRSSRCGNKNSVQPIEQVQGIREESLFLLSDVLGISSGSL